MKNKKPLLIIGLVLVVIFSSLSASVKAETLCSYAGPDLSEDLLRLTDFSVSELSPLREGDQITVKFKLRNYGQYDLNLGQRGIFVAARDPDNLDTSFGFTRSNTTLKVGETVSVEVSRVLDKAGTWKVWPSYHLSLATGEKLGPDNWHTCSLTVEAKIIDSDKDGISDQEDNCPYDYNPKQEDIDKDGRGGVCDPCDDRDSDQDKIKNCLDKCPNEAETYNNYQDEDGCPDEVPKEVKDSDQDGISDGKDKCPKEKEIFNKYQDDDGCPDEVPKKDTTPPTVTISHTPFEVNTASNVTFTAVAQDNTGVSKIILYVNRTQVKECAPPDFVQGNWRCIYTGGPYPDGTLTYKAEAFDVAGNKGVSMEERVDINLSALIPVLGVVRQEYRLPCYLSGSLYNFTYDSTTVRVKVCEAERSPELGGGNITQCKLDEAMWYVNVSPRWNVSIVLEPVRIMDRSPRGQGIRVDLANWWRDVPPEREIEIDPVFSALHFYWLDGDGNLCHGEPGISGQPGTDYVYNTPTLGELRTKERNSEFISIDELGRYQSDSHVIGGVDANLIQYSIHVWRIRADGKLFSDSFSGFSLPMDVRLTEDYVSPAFTRPVDAFGAPLNDCFSAFGLPVPSTGLGGQHPTKCHNRQNVSASDLIQACLEGRLNGSFDEGYFQIVEGEPSKPLRPPAPTLVYQTMVACNGSYLIEPVCQPHRGRCEWQGSWILSEKGNFVVVNGTSQAGYDFTFGEEKRVNVLDVFVNFLSDIWSSLTQLFKLK